MRRFLIIVFALFAGRDAAAQNAPALVEIRDGLYKLQAGDQASIVLVSSDAILIGDPLSVRIGQWLRSELSTRFPGKPVRYVIYTSPTFERAAGGFAFPGATFIGHRAFNTHVLKVQGLPSSLSVFDANRDGRLNVAEYSGSDLEPFARAADKDRDGVVTSSEALRIIPFTKEALRDQATISVGDAPVQFVNAGNGAFTGSMLFPAHRVLYVGAHPAFAAEGFGYGAARPRDVTEWLRGATTLAFDTVITGHGDVLTREQFEAVARYGEEFDRAAADLYARGHSAERAAASPAMQKYSGNALDARRRDNFAHWFRAARVSRTEVQGAGFARLLRPDALYCSGYDSCTVPDYIVGGRGGLRMTWSRLGAVIEGSFAEQYIVERQGFFDDEVFAQRSSRGALLFRVGSTRPSSASIDLLFGPSMTIQSSSGLTRVKQAVAPFGGRHLFSQRRTTAGVTAGINLIAPFSRAVSFYVPIRATWLDEVSSATTRRPDRLDAEAGIGFSIRISQRIR